MILNYNDEKVQNIKNFNVERSRNYLKNYSKFFKNYVLS